MTDDSSRQFEYLTVVFTDLEGSVALKEHHGELFGERVRQHLDDLTRRAAVAVGSSSFRYVKSTGDGALLVFKDPTEAVKVGAELLRQTHGVVEVDGTRVRLSLRVGIEAGLVFSEGPEPVRDVHGKVVDRSSRIMNLAGGGHMLTSSVVREAWADEALPTLRWLSHGAQKVRGLLNPVPVWEAYDERLGPPPRLNLAGTAAMTAGRQWAFARGLVVGASPAVALMVPPVSSFEPRPWLSVLLVGVLLAVQAWQQFRAVRDSDDRGELIGALLFFSIFVVLSGPLLVAAYTSVDPYGLFLVFGPGNGLATIGGALVINALLAYGAVRLFWTLYYGSLARYLHSVEACTFLSVVPPLLLAYAGASALAQRGSETYLLIAFFPLLLAFLAIVGYSHPINKTDLFTARLLLVVCVVAMVVGFLLAVGGLLFHLAYLTPEIPVRFATFFWEAAIPWSSMPYPAAEFAARFRAGFVWMVLSSSFFLELFVGAPTTLVIYHFQYLPSTVEDRIRRRT